MSQRSSEKEDDELRGEEEELRAQLVEEEIAAGLRGGLEVGYGEGDTGSEEEGEVRESIDGGKGSRRRNGIDEPKVDESHHTHTELGIPHNHETSLHAFLTAKTWVLVGGTGNKMPGFKICKAFRDQNPPILAVNPRPGLTRLRIGVDVFPSIGSLPNPKSCALIFVIKPERTFQALLWAAPLEIGVVWFEPGSWDEHCVASRAGRPEQRWEGVERSVLDEREGIFGRIAGVRSRMA